MHTVRLLNVLVGIMMVLFGMGLLGYCLLTQNWDWSHTLKNLPPLAGAVGTVFMGSDLIRLGQARPLT